MQIQTIGTRRFFFGSVDKLKPSDIFVFGSNEGGFHGAGAAGYAMRGTSANTWRDDPAFLAAMKAPIGSQTRRGKWAVFGIGRGFQQGTEGCSYAIATVTKPGAKRSIPLKEIAAQMKELGQFASEHPEMEFFCAIVGGGYNGYSKEEINKLYTLWQSAPSNIIFPRTN